MIFENNITGVGDYRVRLADYFDLKNKQIVHMQISRKKKNKENKEKTKEKKKEKKKEKRKKQGKVKDIYNYE